MPLLSEFWNQAFERLRHLMGLTAEKRETESRNDWEILSVLKPDHQQTRSPYNTGLACLIQFDGIPVPGLK
jgi:hypothetical protein